MKLAGKSAIVTGAGRGIGKADAPAFAQEGADILINYSRSEAKAKEGNREDGKKGIAL